jgi:hypothetical protein
LRFDSQRVKTPYRGLLHLWLLSRATNVICPALIEASYAVIYGFSVFSGIPDE